MRCILVSMILHHITYWFGNHQFLSPFDLLSEFGKFPSFLLNISALMNCFLDQNLMGYVNVLSWGYTANIHSQCSLGSMLNVC